MSPPPLLVALLQRGSCRVYQSEPIGPEDWQVMLAAGQQAPTDATGQLYSFVDVTDADLRALLAPLAGDQDHVRLAPKFVIVCLDVRRLRLLLERRGQRLGMGPLISLLFGITDASLAAHQLVMAAASLGYGACYVGGVQNHPLAIARALQLPEGVIPLWGLTLGRPAADITTKPRLPTRLVVHENRYRDPSSSDLDAAYAAMASATRSGDWLNPIRKYFAQGGVMQAREDEFRRLLADQGLPLGESGADEPADGHVGI